MVADGFMLKTAIQILGRSRLTAAIYYVTKRKDERTPSPQLCTYRMRGRKRERCKYRSFRPSGSYMEQKIRTKHIRSRSVTEDCISLGATSQ